MVVATTKEAYNKGNNMKSEWVGNKDTLCFNQTPEEVRMHSGYISVMLTDGSTKVVNLLYCNDELWQNVIAYKLER